MILADEINRTPPKTQAALLEAMQEHQVTAGGVRYPLEEPFFVLATQNPIEMEGTYPLPEAQLDRFMFNVMIDYLPEDDEVAVVSADHFQHSRSPSNRSSPVTTCGSSMRSSGKSRGRRPGPLCRTTGLRQPSSAGGFARLCQQVGQLGCRACGPPNTVSWEPRPEPC